jgi:hypothetical protein
VWVYAVAYSQNDQISTMAGQERCNVGIGSHRANITRIRDDFDKVGDVKPVVIEPSPCLSEAAKQQADCGVGQSKTASAR